MLIDWDSAKRIGQNLRGQINSDGKFVITIAPQNSTSFQGVIPKGNVPQAQQQQMVQRAITSQLERQMWVVVRAFGDNYYDIQLGSSFVLEFSFDTGKLSANGDYLNSNPTRYDRVFNATGVKLEAGDQCRIAFRDNDLGQKPYIKALVRMPFGNKTAPDPPPIPGLWDQTWANFYRSNAGGLCLADTAKWQDHRREVFDLTDADYSITWRGMAYTKNGMIYVVTRRFKDGENVAFVVRLLEPNGGTYALRASVVIPLIGTDRGTKDRYPDAETFYDPTNDTLTILRPYVNEYTKQARIWTVQANTTYTSLRWAKSEVECSYYRSMTCANLVGKRLATLDGNAQFIFGYKLDLKELKWTVEWKQSVASMALAGSAFSMAGSTGNVPAINYGPPWSNRQWFTLSSQVTAGKAVLQELAISESGGAIGARVNLWSLADFGRSTPIKLNSVINAYVAEVFEAQQGTNINFPPTGTETEDILSHPIYYGNAEVGPTVEWDVYLRRYWLGVLYSSYSIEITARAPSTPENITFPYYVPHGFGPGFLTPPVAALRDVIDAIPPPTGLPLHTPNGIRNYHDRPFWRGQTDTDLSGGGIGSAPARGIRLPDGSRVWASLVPVPYFVPDYAHPYYTQELNQQQYKATWYYLDTGAVYSHFFDYTDQRKYSYHCPIVKFAFETHLFRVFEDGSVTNRKISQEFTDIPWPGYTFGTTITCTEPLPIPESVWEIFYIPEYDQIGCLYDWRATYDEDPTPRIEVFRADNWEPVYHIAAASLIFQFEPFVKFTEDKVYEGDTWAIEGQYEYDFHTFDRSGPQIKIWKQADGRPLLVFGAECQQRVEPLEGTGGVTQATMQAFVLNETSFEGTDFYTAEGHGWAYPDKYNYSNTENGPYVVRTMMPGPDRLIYSAFDKLNEMPA